MNQIQLFASATKMVEKKGRKKILLEKQYKRNMKIPCAEGWRARAPTFAWGCKGHVHSNGETAGAGDSVGVSCEEL